MHHLRGSRNPILDLEGLWSVPRKLFMLTPRADPCVLLNEGAPQQADAPEQQSVANQVGVGLLRAGSDLRTAWSGSRKGRRTAYSHAPVPRAPLAHCRDAT